MGEVRLDGGKLGRMGFRTRPTHQNRAIGQLRRGNYYNAVQFGYDRHEPEGYLGNVGFFLLYGFPVSLAGLALYMTFRKHDPTLAMFGGFGFASHGLFVVLTAAVLLVGLRFPQEFAFFGAESGPVAGIASSLELTMDKIGKSAFVFLGLGLLPVGVLILRTGAVARWIGWLGSAAGILAFFGFLAGLAGILEDRAIEVVIPSVMLPSFAFMLILGFRLISREVR